MRKQINAFEKLLGPIEDLVKLQRPSRYGLRFFVVVVFFFVFLVLWLPIVLFCAFCLVFLLVGVFLFVGILDVFWGKLPDLWKLWKSSEIFGSSPCRSPAWKALVRHTRQWIPFPDYCSLISIAIARNNFGNLANYVSVTYSDIFLSLGVVASAPTVINFRNNNRSNSSSKTVCFFK